MIDAIELKINSWVQNDAGVCWQFKTFGELADNFDEQNDTKVEPYGIPLSPDILEKCGFLKTEANNTYTIDLKEYGLRKLYIAFSDGVSIFALGDCHSTKETIILIGDDNFQYLHQLQNLYYSLTQTELNIQL